jgi:thiol-disulfide isomerase/thioredoxin
MLKVKPNFLFYLIGFIFIAIFYSIYMSAKKEEINAYELQRQQDQVRVIYFGAEWCDPCKIMRKTFEQKEIKSELDKLLFRKYDIDIDIKESEKWAIKSVPTIITIDKNGKIKRYTGLLKKEQLSSILSELLN